MSDIRVLACLTSGSRYARHPGVGHKKKANRTTAQEETNTDTYKEKKYKQKNGREKDTKKTTA